jgi:DNA-binding Xre family transcriptional regulator
MTTRSLRASEEGIKKAKKALIGCSLTKTQLAINLEITRQPVYKFFKGKPVDYQLFVRICKNLNLSWEDIALQENTSEISQEQCNPVGVLTELAAITEEQNKTGEERVAYAVTGTMAKVDIPKVKAILALLQEITGDTSIGT